MGRSMINMISLKICFLKQYFLRIKGGDTDGDGASGGGGESCGGTGNEDNDTGEHKHWAECLTLSANAPGLSIKVQERSSSGSDCCRNEHRNAPFFSSKSLNILKGARRGARRFQKSDKNSATNAPRTAKFCQNSKNGSQFIVQVII